MTTKNDFQKDKKLKDIIKMMISDPVISQDKDLVSGLQAILEDFGSHEYRITIIGEFSSGKSTFLNAIIGQDILPHGVEETTAAVTYIHNVRKEDKKFNKVKIFFRNGRTPEILDLSTSRTALIDYVTAKSKNKDVVKEIEEVHLYVNFMEGGENLVLIDTPGLNGIKDGMRDITYREIMRSHANICLFHVKGVSQTDVEFIDRFYKDGTPFFFVLNQIDRLTEETPEEKLIGFSKDIKDTVLHTQELPKFVYGVSALQALSARDKTIKRVYADDKEDLSEEKREYYLNKSGFLTLEKSLLDFIKNGEMEKNYLDQIKSRVINLLEIARNGAEADIELLQAKVSDIPEKKILETQKAKVLESIQKNLNVLKTKLGSNMADLENSQKTNIRRICESITEQANAIVNNWTSLDYAERDTKNGKVVNFINNKVNLERQRIESRLTPEFDRIFDNLISIVRSFVPNVAYSKKESKWDFTIEREGIQDDSKLRRLNQQISDIKAEREYNERKKQDADKQKLSIVNEIYSKEKTKAYLESNKIKAIRALGYEPSYRTWTETRPKRKYFLGLFSYKSSEEYEVNNMSEIQSYREKKRQIEYNYDSQIRATDSAIKGLIQKKEGLDPSIYDSIENTLRRKQEILESQKRREEEELELQRKYARTKLLNKLKEKARGLITRSIEPNSGELYLSLSDDIRNNIRHAETKMKDDLESEYARLRSIFLNQLEKLIMKVEAKEDVENNVKTIAQLENKASTISQFLTKLYN